MAAREAFARVDTILSDNADALHEMIGNINTFAGALARNSDRIDTIVAGLERMTGSAAAEPATIYDLTAPEEFEPGLTVPAHQLVVTLPTSLVSLDTQRFLVRSGDSETLAFDAAKWSDSIPALIRAKVIQGFENAGYLHTGGDTQGLAADRQLLIDIRSFAILSGTASVAEIAFSAKILSADGQVIDGRIFRASAPVSAMQAEAAAAALDQAFGTAARELIPWAMRIP
jgi:phospholipid/cholesterol/gamma-HCH transport system substrate-binding protein